MILSSSPPTSAPAKVRTIAEKLTASWSAGCPTSAIGVPAYGTSPGLAVRIRPLWGPVLITLCNSLGGDSAASVSPISQSPLPVTDWVLATRLAPSLVGQQYGATLRSPIGSGNPTSP